MKFLLAQLCLLPFTAASAFAQIGTIIAPPVLANQNGHGDSGHDFSPALVSNGNTIWSCVFATTETSLTNGGDTDVFWIRSRDLGVTWSVPAPISSSFLTDTGITSTDFEPALATDGDSRMVVWSSTKTSPTGHLGIYSAYSTSTSTLWVNPLPVGAVFAADAVHDNNPCIAGANDTYVTVWERPDSAADRDLWFSRTVGNGGPSWSAPARIDASSAADTGSDTHARIATDGAGHWVVVYQSLENHFGTGTDAEIYAYRSSDDGVTWIGPSLVNATAASDGGADDTEPAVAVDVASGTWMCAWRSLHTFAGSTGGDAEIVRSKSVDLGSTWGTVALVNTDFATDQSVSTGDLEPFIHADQDGHFMISWTRSLINDSDTDLRAARSDDLGGVWTAPVRIDIDAELDGGVDSAPQLVADGNGHWVAVWQSNDNVLPSYGSDVDVLTSRFLIPRADDEATFCYGYAEVGNAPRCPCGNDASLSSHQGCLNSAGTGGRVAMGSPLSASAPFETIQASGVPPGAPVLLFQGTGQLNYGMGTSFGDGLLCAGGTLIRLGVFFSGVSGTAVMTFPPTGISAGSTRFYQGWYRDSASFCTSSTFNLTSAFGTVWQP